MDIGVFSPEVKQLRSWC